MDELFTRSMTSHHGHGRSTREFVTMNAASQRTTDAQALTVVQEGIMRTLLYYDIWSHPLTRQELALFFPWPLREPGEFPSALHALVGSGVVYERNGYYCLRQRSGDVFAERKCRERRARKMWKIARLSTHIIKRFPFVRAVMVSGELSKNVAGPDGDIDFFILTEPHRLWLTRSLLVLFKKVVLLNSKTFFCINYFASTNHLEEEDRNVYVATEVAHVKPLYNRRWYSAYLEANRWILTFFPQFEASALPSPAFTDRRSVVQPIVETLLSPLPLTRIDQALQRFWQRIWARRYPEVDGSRLEHAFTTTATTSRAYTQDCCPRVIDAYRSKLESFGLRLDAEPQSAVVSSRA